MPSGNTSKVRTKPAIPPIHYAVVGVDGKLVIAANGSGPEMIFSTRKEALTLVDPMDPDKAGRRVVMIKIEVIA